MIVDALGRRFLGGTALNRSWLWRREHERVGDVSIAGTLGGIGLGELEGAKHPFEALLDVGTAESRLGDLGL